MSKPCQTCAGSGTDYAFDVEITCIDCGGTGDEDGVVLGQPCTSTSPRVVQRVAQYHAALSAPVTAPRPRYTFSARRIGREMVRQIAQMNALFFWAAGTVLLCQGAYLPSIAASGIASTAVLCLIAMGDE